LNTRNVYLSLWASRVASVVRIVPNRGDRATRLALVLNGGPRPLLPHGGHRWSCRIASVESDPLVLCTDSPKIRFREWMLGPSTREFCNVYPQESFAMCIHKFGQLWYEIWGRPLKNQRFEIRVRSTALTRVNDSGCSPSLSVMDVNNEAAVCPERPSSPTSKTPNFAPH
jgi:hypothetical protein